jgi:hypothetical protein
MQVLSEADVTVRPLGYEREPLVIIENFCAEPEALMAEAEASTFGPAGPHYPGIRARADPAYLARRMTLLQEVLRAVFNFRDGASLVECNFSLVTQPPDTLRPIQRLPHFDSTDPGRIALLHYLCGPEMGGTAFYRHRATGFESICAARLASYGPALEAEVRGGGLPEANYVAGDTDLFAETARVDAAFNRMAIYRGRLLHSGAIPADFGFSPVPRAGRLTVNTFLQAQ